MVDFKDEGYEVVCFLANVGQEEDWTAVTEKALKIGATKMIIDDLRREFAEELCFRAVQCNAIYEGRYLLGMFSLPSEAMAPLTGFRNELGPSGDCKGSDACCSEGEL